MIYTCNGMRGVAGWNTYMTDKMRGKIVAVATTAVIITASFIAVTAVAVAVSASVRV